MAKKEVDEPKGRTQTFYVPATLQSNMDRLSALCEKYHVSSGIVINLLIDTCLPTLEKEMPERRKFMLNNKEITL